MSDRVKILVTGASGKLGGYLVRESPDVVPLGHSWQGSLLGRSVERLDLRDGDAVRACLARHKPHAVLHLAALSDVKECFANPELAERVNRVATADLARACHEYGLYLLSVSTDMVFDGEQAPYDENAAPTPCSVYGRSKAQGEEEVLAYPAFAVARVGLLVGPTLTERRSHYDSMLEQLRAGNSVRLFEDEWRAMVSMRTAARTLLELCRLRPTGILHIAGERLSRYELGLLVADALGVSRDRLVPGSRSEFSSPEPRQKDLTLSCARLRELLPDWTSGELLG